MHLLNSVYEMEKKVKNPTYFSVIEEKINTVHRQKVLILTHQHGHIYLIGTHHNREASALAVEHLIREVQPQIVAVELCLTSLERFHLGSYVTSKSKQTNVINDMDFIPTRLRERALGEKLLLGMITESLKYEKYCQYRDKVKRFAMVNPYTRKFSVRPKVFYNVLIGREMTLPFGRTSWFLLTPNDPLQYLASRDRSYKILLADKPVEETFCDIATALSEDEKKVIRVYESNFIRLFTGTSNHKTLVLNLMEKNKKLADAIVKSRDRYIARTVCNALRQTTSERGSATKIICVIGQNHVSGVHEYIKYFLNELDKIDAAIRDNAERHANSEWRDLIYRRKKERMMQRWRKFKER